MLTEPTIDKLKSLHLYAMADAWIAQKSDPAMSEIDFDARSRCSSTPSRSRATTSASRVCCATPSCASGRVHGGHRPVAKRELDRTLVRTLAQRRWIADHQNVLVTGMTGVGKTYVACALAQLACRSGLRALYRRTLRLFEELALSHADARTPVC